MEKTPFINYPKDLMDLYSNPKMTGTITPGTSEVDDPFSIGEDIGVGVVWEDESSSTSAVTSIESSLESYLTREEIKVTEELGSVSSFVTKLQRRSRPEDEDIRSTVASNIYDLIEND